MSKLYQNKLHQVVDQLHEYKEEKEVVKAPTQSELAEYIELSDTKISQMCDGDYERAARLAGLIPRSNRVPGDFMEAL